MTLAHDWRTARPAPELLHLDSAAAGRSSTAVLDAVAAHLRREAVTGAYVAASAAEPSIAAARAGLAQLLGRAPEDVAFVESATVAFAVLLRALRLPVGAAVWVTPGEYGPNLAALAAHELAVRPLAVTDAVGHLDLAALERALAAGPPALVHLCQLGSHRGVVQPVAQALALCRAAGVPVVVDAAQALGHVGTDTGADAVYATSRKWLAGPRGVGVLAVAPSLGLDAAALESSEAFVAGRIGLGVAVAEHLALVPSRVHEALADIGARARGTLDGVAGWRVVEPHGEPSATTTLAPPPGWSDAGVERARERLLVEHRVLVTLAAPGRAPLEATRTVLRVAPHLDTDDADLDGVARALVAVS